MLGYLKVFCVLSIISFTPLFLPLAFSQPRLPKKYDIDLGKIVVTASKLEQTYKYSTQNISVVDFDDIDSAGVIQISEILDLLPSVDILDQGATGSYRAVYTRGASSAQVLTLVDGRPVNTHRDGVADFNQIPLSNIDRIEVLRGPASNIYGTSAVGGVINIITKSGSDAMQTQLLSKFGSFATRLVSLSQGYKINDFDYFISYDYLASHGHRDNSDFLSHNANAKIGYQINSDNRISVSGGYYNSELGVIGQIPWINLDDKQEMFKKYVDLTYNGRLIKGQDLLFKFYYNSDRLEFIESYNPTIKHTHNAKLFGYESQISQTFWGFLRTAIGVDYKEYKLDSTSTAKHANNVKGVYVESEAAILENDNFILNRGSLKIGARWDDYSNFGDRLSPSWSFSAWFLDSIKLHALVAKSFRAPTFNDLYWPVQDYVFWGVSGNPDLGPEKAVSYEAGLSTYLFNKFKTDITFFKTDFNDLIQWGYDGIKWYKPDNVSSAKIKGAEIETEFVLEDKLKANLNYTYLEAKDAESGGWLLYRPRHMYKLKVFYSPFEDWELGVDLIYKTRRLYDGVNDRWLGHDWVINFDFSYDINQNTKLMFEVKNLFDRQYEEQNGYPLPGRAFYGGMKISF